MSQAIWQNLRVASMPLATGVRIGSYEIVGAIGAGGMGEVYRARDTRLDRDVAIKVLPDQFVADPERVARFEREAKALAALNHTNIAQIYGLEGQVGHEGQAGRESQAGTTACIVMELVEGPTLAERVAETSRQGQGNGLPLDEALAIARQIADALEAAHEQGIVHRDLKPANIKIKSDGTVKVLDFGLAKAMESGGGPPTPSASMSPTITTPAMTLAGVILGTAAYMSPEQAKGRVADRRSDVWAFGCVFYEMLAGKRAFEGEDVSDTLAAVLRGAPDWDALPKATPSTIRTVLRRCLERDRRERVRDIGDVQLALKGAFEAPAPAAEIASPPARPRPLWKRVVPALAAAAVVGAFAGAAAWKFKPAPAPPRPITRFTVTLDEGQQFTSSVNQSLAISPDGTRLVYVANAQLFLRSMSDLQARTIPGAERPLAPVFSPDGHSIAFYTLGEKTIKKIPAIGGAAQTICQTATLALQGMSWDATGILFGQPNKGILRVSENGGEPELLVAAKDSRILASPQILPGGEWLLFTSAAAPTLDAWDHADIVVQSLKTGEQKKLFKGSDARYLPTGHLLFAVSGIVYAVPFDLKRLAVTGGPVPVVEGVRRATTGTTGTAHFVVSNTGSLAFTPGPTSTTAAPSDLALIEPNGLARPLRLPPNSYEYPRVSPNGKWIAVGTDDGKEAAIWIYDRSGTSAPRKLTTEGRNRVPVWADNERVAFQSDRGGDLAVWWQRADQTAPAERLTTPQKDTTHVPESWSPDGRTLLISVARGSTSTPFTLTAFTPADGKLIPFGSVESAFPPAATFSPDGKWVAYSIAAAGAGAGSLFVQAFPPTGQPIPISKGTGIASMWSASNELFYSPSPGAYVGVAVTTKPAFNFGNPAPVTVGFTQRGPQFERNHDVTPDGKYFLGVVAAGQGAAGVPSAPTILVVLNWLEELKARVPTGGDARN